MILSEKSATFRDHALVPLRRAQGGQRRATPVSAYAGRGAPLPTRTSARTGVSQRADNRVACHPATERPNLSICPSHSVRRELRSAPGTDMEVSIEESSRFWDIHLRM